MNGLERTRAFLKGESVDRPPCHPILMRWAACYAGIPYRDFCLLPEKKCEAMIRCAEDFDLDWVTVMSDPWAEASAFGIEVEYPEDALPIDTGGHLPDVEAACRLKPFRTLERERIRNRLRELELFKERVGDRLFTVGWVEGPVAEYADLRGVSNAAMDFLDDPEGVEEALEVIVESALEFIRYQVEAGAHAIGIGDAFCSQIGPILYKQFGGPGERRMVEKIHELGAVAKLHICGDTTAILPQMIETGADIVDVDHLVADMAPFAQLLKPGQVLCGKCDPVAVVSNGTEAHIRESVHRDFAAAGGRCIVSAGCEITPETSVENMRALRAAVDSLTGGKGGHGGNGMVGPTLACGQREE